MEYKPGMFIGAPLVNANIRPSLSAQIGPDTPGGLNDYISAYNNAIDGTSKATAWQGAKSYVNNSMIQLKQQYEAAKASGNQRGMVEAHNLVKSIIGQYAENFRTMEQAQALNMRRQQREQQGPLNQPGAPGAPGAPALGAQVQPKASPNMRAVNPVGGLKLPGHTRTV